jgi:hypothetical protein
MNRATLCDFEQSRALFLAEVTHKRNMAPNLVETPLLAIASFAILGVDARVLQSHLHFLKRPLLSLRVNLYGHCGAGPKRG